MRDQLVLRPLSTRPAAPRFTGKAFLDWILLFLSLSVSIIALSCTAVILLFTCILVSFFLRSIKSNSVVGILGLIFIGIGLLLFMGLDSGALEGFRGRFFDDANSIDIRVNLANFAYNLIVEHPFVGSGVIGDEYGQLLFHNLFLGAWAAAGIFGLIAALLYFIILSVMWLRALNIARLQPNIYAGWSVDWLHALILPALLKAFVAGSLGLVGGFAFLCIGIGLYANDQISETLRSKDADRRSANSPATANIAENTVPEI